MENSVFLTALAYLHRLRGKLPSTARGLPCTLHRIVIASFLIATKYLQDSPARNRHWAIHSGCFSQAEINLMERQLLFLLDFEVSTSPEVLTAILARDRAYMASITKPSFIALPPPVESSAAIVLASCANSLTPSSPATLVAGAHPTSVLPKPCTVYTYNLIPTPDEEPNPFFSTAAANPADGLR